VTIVRFETDPHTTVQSLLPWYATRRLDADDLALVETHLATCPSCRAELDIDNRLRVLMSDAPPAGDTDQAWRAMRAKLANDDAGPRRAGKPWLRWLVGAQTALVATLAGLLLWPHGAPAPAGEDYRALGTPAAAAAPNAIVMFRPAATEAQMRAALRASGARLVGGPTATNAYLLRLPSAGHDTIAALRAQPGVTLAESLDAAP